ncbi:MAG: cyanoexosortase C [Leptolyngbyaceae cyanobacterium bins.302]|nr:cyanoexosortase C [Leptolyngbyaceae cyanobacterium bins.302]
MTQSNSESRLKTFGRNLGQRSRSLLKTACRTTHNRIVTCGVLVLLLFLPGWFSVVLESIFSADSSVLLNAGFTYLGLDILWKNRQQLMAEPAPEEERVLGYVLILGGAVCFPLCLASVSLQALVCVVVLLGIAICNWGIAIVQKHPLAIVLILISVYPDLGFLGNTLRRTLTGKQLETLMAWLGGLALSAIGQPTSVDGPFLSLSTTFDPKKAVEVASGCSGFDMAFPIAGFALIIGMFFKQSWKKTFALIVIGVLLALAFNVPRIMLLAFAVVYWGKASFEFWHGPIGGQIFSTIMLTTYYYIAMAIIHRKPKLASHK